MDDDDPHATDSFLAPSDIHVLLVDDEPLSRLVVGNLLRKCSYRGACSLHRHAGARSPPSRRSLATRSLQTKKTSPSKKHNQQPPSSNPALKPSSSCGPLHQAPFSSCSPTS